MNEDTCGSFLRGRSKVKMLGMTLSRGAGHRRETVNVCKASVGVDWYVPSSWNIAGDQDSGCPMAEIEVLHPRSCSHSKN